MRTVGLTQGKVTVVDDDDFELVRTKCWCAANMRGQYYAVSRERLPSGKYRNIYLHRWLLLGPCAPRDGREVDHRDGNTLNNQRCNLRITDRRGNLCNRRRRTPRNPTSIYKGVSKSTSCDRWAACIRGGPVGQDGKRKTIHLGLFLTERDAARAYDRAAKQYHGEFAALNFQDGQWPSR